MDEENEEDKSLPIFITEDDDNKRDYVFTECQKLIDLYKRDININEKKLQKYKENKFHIIIKAPLCIIIEFTENNTNNFIITTSNNRKITIKYLKGDDKTFWLINEQILNYYLKKFNVMYPIYIINNLDYTLNEENFEAFILSECKIINESDKPNIDFDEIQNNLSQNRNFSKISLSNKYYFKNSYNQKNLDNKLLLNSYKFTKLIQTINENKFKELKIIKNSKSGFSSLLYSNLKMIKQISKNLLYLYIDLRFFQSDTFSSKEKTETLLKEAFFATNNENEFKKLKEIILKFNNYSLFIKKLQVLIQYFDKEQKKIIIIFDHLDFKDLAALEKITKTNNKKLSTVFIFSLEDFQVQETFLEQIEIKPIDRNYYLILNYPQINELPKQYLIFNNNPYYYGIENTNINKTLEQICGEERIKIFVILENFYKNNIKNLFFLLRIKNIVGEDNINYIQNRDLFHNIPLDLFKIELNEGAKEIKKIDYKNYLVKKSIKQFIRQQFILVNTESEIIEEMTGSNIGFVLEDLFDIFFTSGKLPFENINYVSELVVDKIINNSKIIIDNDYSISQTFNKKNIFISQDKDNAKNYDSALILNYNNKTILKIYQVTEGEKKTKALKEKYTKEKLKQELLNVVSSNLEKLLKIRFDIIEFKFVLDYYTYEKKASNIIEFCNENNINYILFDCKKFLLYYRDKTIIRELKIDKKSIIIQNDNIINNFYNKEEFSSEEGEDKINISNINEEEIITNNLNASNNSFKEIVSKIPDKTNNNYNNFIDIDEEGDIIFGKPLDDESKLINFKYAKHIKIIEGEKNVQIGIESKNGEYCGNIFVRVQKIKELRDIKIKCRIHLFGKLSITNIINTFKLKENQFIHAYMNKKFYLIFLKDRNIEIYCEDNHTKEIKLIEKSKDIIFGENSSILVFNYKRKVTSQNNTAEKRKKISEKEDIKITNFNSYFQ